MRTRLNHLLVLSLLSMAAILLWPASGSAQVLEEACVAQASLTPISSGDHLVTGAASYTCDNQQPIINATGCLLLDGAPVFCDGDLRMNSSSAAVDLQFPCVPGAWSVVAMGSGANRILPAADVAGPVVITDCDPLSP